MNVHPLLLMSCPNRWPGRLFQILMIFTKKEYFRELTFADSAFGSYMWMVSFSVFAFTILAVVIEVQAI